MAIETFEFIDDLNAANPTATDNVSEGDDHLRGLKTTLKNTFPNVTGAVNATETELNILDGVTATTAEINYLDGVTSNIQTQLGTKLESETSHADVLVDGDVGTTANKIVQLNASAELPAVSGANLTNLPAGGATDINGLSDGYSAGRSVGLGEFALAVDDGTNNSNVAVGKHSLASNTSGQKNTASGYGALTNTTTGSHNTAVGFYSLGSTVAAGANGNTASGSYSLTNNNNGSYHTALGYEALMQTVGGVNVIGIGWNADASTNYISNELTLGNSSISNLRCNDTSISSLSDQRDKAEITDLPEEAGLSLINSLRPVTYFWDRREWYDDGVTDGSKIKRDYRSWKANSGLRQGFIAQEVETAIVGHKYLEDSQVVNGTVDKKEFAPQHLLTNAIKAIQQLSSENEALKIRLTALENT